MPSAFTVKGPLGVDVKTKRHRLFYLYGCFSVDKLFYLKNEYPTDFKTMKTHTYGFSIKGNIDLTAYEVWYDQY